MTAKHTPGPWYSMPYSLQVTDKKIWFDEDGSRHGDTPNMILDCLTEADCHLIAAAPDLLEAAIRALRDCSDLIGTPSGDALAAAIAKATGEQT